MTRTFQNESKQKQYVKELLLRDQMGDNDLKARIRAYHSVNQSGLCGNNMSVTLVVDHFERNLEQEVKRRAKNNNRFEEQELWYILGSLAELFS
jgi:hypothetical protein